MSRLQPLERPRPPGSLVGLQGCSARVRAVQGLAWGWGGQAREVQGGQVPEAVTCLALPTATPPQPSVDQTPAPLPQGRAWAPGPLSGSSPSARPGVSTAPAVTTLTWEHRWGQTLGTHATHPGLEFSRRILAAFLVTAPCPCARWLPRWPSACVEATALQVLWVLKAGSRLPLPPARPPALPASRARSRDPQASRVPRRVASAPHHHAPTAPHREARQQRRVGGHRTPDLRLSLGLPEGWAPGPQQHADSAATCLRPGPVGGPLLRATISRDSPKGAPRAAGSVLWASFSPTGGHGAEGRAEEVGEEEGGHSIGAVLRSAPPLPPRALVAAHAVPGGSVRLVQRGHPGQGAGPSGLQPSGV